MNYPAFVITVIFVLLAISVVIYGITRGQNQQAKYNEIHEAKVHALSESLGYIIKIVHDQGDEELKKKLEISFPYMKWK